MRTSETIDENGSDKKLSVEKTEIGENEVTTAEADSQYSTIYSSYRVLFFMASMSGLHIIRRNTKNQYVIGKYRLMVTIIVFLNSLWGSYLFICIYLYDENPYWYYIMILPTLMSFIYLNIMNIFVWVNRKKMIRYLVSLSVIKVKRSWHFYPMLICLSLFSIIVVFPLSLLLPKNMRLSALQPIILASCATMLQDEYVGNFLWCIAAGYQTLEEDVRQTISWDQEKVVEVCGHWLNLKRLLMMHNEVCSRIYSY